jgi:hypothetical protein
MHSAIGGVLQLIGVPAHTPPPHWSMMVQASRSSQLAVFVGCVHAPAPSQRSSVQTSPSSEQGAPAGSSQESSASPQLSAHSPPPAHGSPACVQAPPEQTSAPLQ